MDDLEIPNSRVKYTYYITSAACSYCGCILAVGTSDNLILLYQIGKKPFVETEEQTDEESRRYLFKTLIDSGDHVD